MARMVSRVKAHAAAAAAAADEAASTFEPFFRWVDADGSGSVDEQELEYAAVSGSTAVSL